MPTAYDQALEAKQRRDARNAEEHAKRQARDGLRAGDPEAYVLRYQLIDEPIHRHLRDTDTLRCELPQGLAITPAIQARLEELRAQGWHVEIRDEPPIGGTEITKIIMISVTAPEA